MAVPGGALTLVASIRTRRGEREIDVALTAERDETVAIVGPNGAGKTTVLECLAGLVPLTAGRVTVGDRVLEDPSTGVRVAPERRSVAYVFQDLLLFPHLTVLENVAFGLRARGTPRALARRRAAEWLDRVDLAWAAGRAPGTLSGGEAQRVALARALAVQPDVVLLDEPLAAVDTAARRGLRRDLHQHLTGFDGVRVLVTHDPLEAAVLADRLLVLEDGRVTQQGTPGDVRSAPRTPYAAALAGLNLLRGRAAGTTVALAGGGELVTADPADGDVFVVIRPEAVTLHVRPPEGSARNVWEGTVRHVEHHDTRVRVDLDARLGAALLAEVTQAGAAALDLRPGVAVWASVKATEVTVQPV